MALAYSRGERMAGLPRARRPVRSTFGRRGDRPGTVHELGRAGSCSHPPADRPKTRFGRRSVRRATGRKLCARCEGWVGSVVGGVVCAEGWGGGGGWVGRGPRLAPVGAGTRPALSPVGGS